MFNLFYRTDADGATALGPYYGPGPLSETIKRRYFDLLCEVCGFVCMCVGRVEEEEGGVGAWTFGEIFLGCSNSNC